MNKKIHRKNNYGNITIMMCIFLSLLIGILATLTIFKKDKKEEVYYEDKATVIKKIHYHALTSTIMMNTGKVMIPVIQVIPERFYLKINYLGKDSEKEVSKKFYECSNVDVDKEINIMINESKNNIKIVETCEDL